MAELLPIEFVEKLAVQIIGDKDRPRAVSLRRYFGIPTARAEIKDQVLSPENLKAIQQAYKIPVIQVLIDQEKPIIMGIANVADLHSTTAVYVIIPDYQDGPAVLTVKNTVGDTVPSIFIQGPIFDSLIGKKTNIEKSVNVTKPKIKRPVINISKSQKSLQEVKPQEDIQPTPIPPPSIPVPTPVSLPQTVKRPIIRPILPSTKK